MQFIKISYTIIMPRNVIKKNKSVLNIIIYIRIIEIIFIISLIFLATATRTLLAVAC